MSTFWRRPLDADRVRPPHGEVLILADRCKGCEFCVEFCPKDVLAMSKDFNRKGYHPPEVVKSGVCMACNLCETICPEFAIFTTTTPESPPAAALPAPVLEGVAP